MFVQKVQTSGNVLLLISLNIKPISPEHKLKGRYSGRKPLGVLRKFSLRYNSVAVAPSRR